MPELKFKDITKKINRASIEVLNFLGNACLATRQGFQELIYKPALTCEFSKTGLSFAREIEGEGCVFILQISSKIPAES